MLMEEKITVQSPCLLEEKTNKQNAYLIHTDSLGKSLYITRRVRWIHIYIYLFNAVCTAAKGYSTLADKSMLLHTQTTRAKL